MTEARRLGYFPETHVRKIMHGWIPEDQAIDVFDPKTQRKVGRGSAIRSLALDDSGKANVVNVFTRMVPSTTTNGYDEFTWRVDFRDPTQWEQVRDFYRKLVGFERKHDTEEVVLFIDDFVKNL